MAIFDIFKRKTQSESNTLFGQTALGNNVVYQGSDKRAGVNTQIAISPQILALLPVARDYNRFNSTFVISGSGSVLDNADVFGRVSDGPNEFGLFTITFGGSTAQRASFTWTYRTNA